MIQGAVLDARADPVLKLVSLPPKTIEAVLIDRGHDPSSVGAALEALVAVGIPVNVNDAVDYSFRAKLEDPTPYGVGRFGDGMQPVFYSALEENTCVEEVRYHQRRAFEALQSGQLSYSRYFSLMKCDFQGNAMILRGHEKDYPDLVSITEAGYPFCQAVANWARGIGANALYSTSARDPNGTCVPVFARENLSDPQLLERYRFEARDGEVEHQKLPHGGGGLP